MQCLSCGACVVQVSAFFRATPAPKPVAGRHYAVVQGHERCQWPEGQLTCRLLDAGARLEPLRVSFRIMAHARLNGGDHPPQTGPRPTPHVCAGRVASLPAVVGQWSTDDVVLWLRQVRPLAL